MKNMRKWGTLWFTLLMCMCFVSVPVLSDGGEQDPWDSDEVGGNGTTGDDQIGDDPFDNGTTRLLNSSGYGIFDSPALLSGFWIPISLQLHDYIYGDKVQLTKSYMQKDNSTDYVFKKTQISDAR